MKQSTTLGAAAAAILAFAAVLPAQAAEPIVGQWRAPGGGIVEVSPCGDAFCAVVVSGQHTGKSVGRMTGSARSYEGTVTDPREDRTYDGSATIRPDGQALELQGCALKVFCKTQTWTRT